MLQQSTGQTAPSAEYVQQEAQLIERAGRLLDIRTKPPEFSGESDAWPEYKFRMEMLMGMLGLKESMANALKDPVAVTEAKIQLSTELRAQSTLLYSLLSETCRGRAHVLVRIESEGFLAWRRLVGEYQPAKAYRYVNLLAKLLNPSFNIQEQFMPQLLRWEQELHEYEAQTGSKLDDGVKCAVVARHAPERIRTFLTMTYEDLSESFEKLKEALQQFHLRNLMYETQVKEQLSEVEAVKGLSHQGGSGSKAKGSGRKARGSGRKAPGNSTNNDNFHKTPGKGSGNRHNKLHNHRAKERDNSSGTNSHNNFHFHRDNGDKAKDNNNNHSHHNNNHFNNDSFQSQKGQ